MMDGWTRRQSRAELSKSCAQRRDAGTDRGPPRLLRCIVLRKFIALGN